MDILLEHRFWLQVLGDHARFIFKSLAAVENEEITRSNHFIAIFDQLLLRARQQISGDELYRFNREIYTQVDKLREFKLHLLRRHLTGKVASNLPPTFFNHMLNELEEYRRILGYLVAGEVPPDPQLLRHHLLWLSDAIFHADAVKTSLDGVEADLRDKSRTFKRSFETLYLKAQEVNGYLRTKLAVFPALTRFNNQAAGELQAFAGFLQELAELRVKDVVLGTLAPLVADHMIREECYYLIKLSQLTGVKVTGCDPAKPRIENL